MVLRLEEVCENIFNVIAPSPYELGETFIRPQEFYENPVYRGKTGFTHEDIKKWWKTTGEGKKHRYWSWFESFNFPGKVLEPFFEGKFEPLSQREMQLLDLFAKIRISIPRFYIIGTKENADAQDMRHEISHGFYYADPEYKNQVLRILKAVSPEDRKKLNKYLTEENGYCKQVLTDETHAWIMTEEKKYLKDSGIKLAALMPVRQALNQLYDNTWQAVRK